MKNRKLAVYALIVATYVALCLTFGVFSYGMVQVRLAEILMVLCLKDREYTYPLTLACFLSNLIGVFNGMNVMVMDVVIGTFATYLSCLAVSYFANILTFKQPLLSLLMPVVINGLLVGAELAYYLKMNFIVMFIYVALGEFIAVTVFGMLVYKPLNKSISDLC